MRITDRNMLLTMKAALEAYDWTGESIPMSPVPVVYIGPQTAVNTSKPVIQICLADEAAEELKLHNVSVFSHGLVILGLVPWEDTEDNELLRADLKTHLRVAISKNRNLGDNPLGGDGHGVQWKIQAVHLFQGAWFGQNRQQYRGVVYDLSIKDTHQEILT